MKKQCLRKTILTILIVLPLFALVACNEEKTGNAETPEPAEKSNAPTLPYKANYSSSFEMGNPGYVSMILQGSWKDWEENKLDNMKNWIADTIIAFHSNSSMIQGADSLQAAWIRARAKYSSVIDSIQAVLPVYSTDRKENWVLVWAKEINTNTNGAIDTTYLMETWRINKDGKADMLLQYDRSSKKK